MDVHDGVIAEVEQQVLPEGVDGLEAAPVDHAGPVGEAALRRRGEHPAADQRLELAGEAVQGVAFGHGGAIRPSSVAGGRRRTLSVPEIDRGERRLHVRIPFVGLTARSVPDAPGG
jgi:hypothetical protein